MNTLSTLPDLADPTAVRSSPNTESVRLSMI